MKKTTGKVLRVESQEDLDKRLEGGKTLDCFVQLNFGLRSSKDIALTKEGDYWVFNGIDSTEEVIKHDDLMKTFIGEAISKGAFYEYGK